MFQYCPAARAYGVATWFGGCASVVRECYFPKVLLSKQSLGPCSCVAENQTLISKAKAAIHHGDWRSMPHPCDSSHSCQSCVAQKCSPYKEHQKHLLSPMPFTCPGQVSWLILWPRSSTGLERSGTNICWRGLFWRRQAKPATVPAFVFVYCWAYKRGAPP